MKKTFTQRAKELEDKLETIENYPQVKSEVLDMTNNFESVKSQINELSVSSGELKNASEVLKQEFETKKQEIDQKIVELDDIKNKNNELTTVIENQLGIVNAEKLALAFKSEADKLQIVNDKWFKRFFILICVLFATTIGIIIWELITGGEFLSSGFAIKFSITAPLLYFVIFIHGQYNHSKQLMDEYTFKSSVARSFEAYRQIFKEDGLNSDNKVDANVLQFFIDTVKDIYKSPCKSYDDVISDKQAKGILEKIIDFFIKAK